MLEPTAEAWEVLVDVKALIEERQGAPSSSSSSTTSTTNTTTNTTAPAAARPPFSFPSPLFFPHLIMAMN
jgi:hypothetical protein